MALPLAVYHALIQAGFLFVSLVIAAGVSFLSYLWYLHRKYDHIPGPKRTSFVFGNAGEITAGFKKGSHFVQMVLEWMQEYGHTIRVFLLHQVFVFTVDPHAIKEILVTKNCTKPPLPIAYLYGARLFGESMVGDVNKERWAKRRAVINPSFHRGFLKSLVPQFNETADILMTKLATLADGETSINIVTHLNRATLDVIGHVAYSMDIDSITEEDSPFPIAVSKAMHGVSQCFRSPAYQRFNPFYQRAHRQDTRDACNLLRRTAREKMEARKAMIARGETPPQDIMNYILKVGEEVEEVDMDMMLDDFVTIFIAGQETTATSLSSTLMELGRRPEIMSKLKKEVESVVGNKSTIDYEDIGKLEYMSMVIKESLRLYPPVGKMLRRLEEDTLIGGYHVPAGTDVFITSFVAARMPEFYPDPYDFKPERFDPNAEVKPSMYRMFPFSLGPRNCIGQVFAQIEMKVLLCKFMQRFQYELHPDQCFEVQETATLRPKGGVNMILTLEA